MLKNIIFLNTLRKNKIAKAGKEMSSKSRQSTDKQTGTFLYAVIVGRGKSLHVITNNSCHASLQRNGLRNLLKVSFAMRCGLRVNIT